MEEGEANATRDVNQIHLVDVCGVPESRPVCESAPSYGKLRHLSEEGLEKISQFVKFGIVGLSNTMISYVAYAVLVAFGCHYLIANFWGFLISVINAFYWNNRYIFKTKEGEIRTLWSSFFKTVTSYAGTSFILNNLLLMVWIDIFKIHEMLGPIINLFITIPVNFLLNKYWAFKTSKKCKEN